MKEKHIVDKAIELRNNGKTIDEISEAINVSRSTVYSWTYGIPIPKDIRKLQYAKRGKIKTAQAREIRKLYQKLGREAAKTGSRLHHAGCMLYWAEGSKSKNSVTFANTDRNMIKLFVEFLKRELFVKHDRIKLIIERHQDNDDTSDNDIKKFWAHICELPLAAITRIKTKPPSADNSFRKNRHKYGVCTVLVCDTKLVQHIYGAIQEYVGFENDKWLY